MTKQRIKGNVSIKKSWAESLGELERELFLSERIQGDVITVSVLEWDVSTLGFVEFTFQPQKAPHWLLRAVIPSQQVVLIIGNDPKSPGALQKLGFAKEPSQATH